MVGKQILVGAMALLLGVGLMPGAAQAFPFTYGVGSYTSTRNSDPQRSHIVNELGAVGSKWTRIEICYSDNSSMEGDTNALAALDAVPNLSVIALLSFCSGTKSVDAWGDFVGRAVSKFGNQVEAWEVINEPNGQGMAASTYKDYLSRAYDKIKAFSGNEVVLVGGLADANPQFLYELYQTGAKDKFDGVALHPYKDEPPEEIRPGREDFLGRLRQNVAVIKANGGGKRLWLTEFGRQSGGARGDQQQADYQVRAAMIARDLPEVEVISLYLMKDDGSGNYGLLRSDLTRKDSFGRWAEMVSKIEGKQYSGQVLIADQQRLEGFDSFSGWDTKDSNNATRCDAHSDSGRDGNGMKIEYKFSDKSAYCAARNLKTFPGAPTTVGMWIDGDNSSNIWRMRIKDATGQTHQLLLGTFPSGWRYVRYDLVNESARDHWGGANDGIIHYPISFESIVVDRNSDRGYHEGAAYIDDIYGLHGAGDYWGYRFGTTVAAWRNTSEGEATVCGIHTRLGERPKYFTVDPNNCPAMYEMR